MEETVHVGFDHGRAIAGTHVRQRLLHGQVHRQRVHAVDFPARDVKAQAAGRKARFGGGFIHRGRHGVEVVFDKEAQRQFPGRRQVHGFQHRTDVDRAVTEIGDRHGVGLRMPVGPGRARRQRYTAANDRVGAQGARLGPLQVHGAAPAFAEALGQAEDFRQGALQQILDRRVNRRLRVNAFGHQVHQRLGQKLVVATV